MSVSMASARVCSRRLRGQDEFVATQRPQHWCYGAKFGTTLSLLSRLSSVVYHPCACAQNADVVSQDALDADVCGRRPDTQTE